MTTVDYFMRAQIVRIATERRNGSEVVTPIWAVVVEGVPYIRNGYGAGSKWYRRVQRTGRAAFVDAHNRSPVLIDNLKDETINLQVDEAYRRKYVGQGVALSQAISAPVRTSTMRITLQ